MPKNVNNIIKAVLPFNKGVKLIIDCKPNVTTLQTLKEVEAGKTNKISCMDELWKKIERRK